MSINDAIGRTTSWLATMARRGHARESGVREANVPEKPVLLYEYEACPMCCRVREAVTDLGLVVEVRPCPRGGTRFRPEAIELAGKRQFPFLVDDNTGVALLESADIVAYLYENYGEGPVPGWLKGPGFAMTSQLASMARGLSGGRAAPSRAPGRRVELQCNESDPDARLVRERLCRLEVPYVRSPGPLLLHDVETDTHLTDANAAIEWLNAQFSAK